MCDISRELHEIAICRLIGSNENFIRCSTNCSLTDTQNHTRMEHTCLCLTSLENIFNRCHTRTFPFNLLPLFPLILCLIPHRLAPPPKSCCVEERNEFPGHTYCEEDVRNFATFACFSFGKYFNGILISAVSVGASKGC